MREQDKVYSDIARISGLASIISESAIHTVACRGGCDGPGHPAEGASNEGVF